MERSTIVAVYENVEAAQGAREGLRAAGIATDTVSIDEAPRRESVAEKAERERAEGTETGRFIDWLYSTMDQAKEAVEEIKERAGLAPIRNGDHSRRDGGHTAPERAPTEASEPEGSEVDTKHAGIETAPRRRPPAYDVPEDARSRYRRALSHPGRALLTIEVDDAERERVLDVLERHTPIDIDQAPDEPDRLPSGPELIRKARAFRKR